MTTDQLNASQKAQVNQWFDLVDKSLDETEKLFDLHFSACRDTLQEMAQCCQRACDVRDLPAAFNWQSGAFKPFAEHSAHYGARLMGLASGTGQEWGRVFEHQWQEMSRQLNGWMGPVSASGGQGPQAAFDYLRNTMQAFDNVWTAARQNMEQSQQAAMRAGQAHKTSAKTNGPRKTA